MVNANIHTIIQVILTAIDLTVENIQSPYQNDLVKDLSQSNFTYLMEIYGKLMKNVAKFMGATSQQAEELNVLLEFEAKLVNVSKTDDPSRKYNSDDFMSVEEIKAKWPSIDWTKFFNSRPQSLFYATNQTKILVVSPTYITDFEKLVRETPKRVLANFAVWKVIQVLIPFVGSATLINIRASSLESNTTLVEFQPLKCTRLLADKMPLFVLSYYLSQHRIDENKVTLINQIISETKKKMIEIFTGSNKFDLKAQNDVVETVNSLNFVVGQTDTVLNLVKFKEYIRELKITNESYLQNHLSLNTFLNSKTVEDSIKPKNSVDLTDAILKYNFFGQTAHYDPSFHTIVINPKYLEKLWMSYHLPNYVNFATIGFTIAHELGHSVDFIKKYENIFGDVENEWSAPTNAEYEKTEACLIEQFNNYTFQTFNQTLNGTQYLLENIADLIGVKTAYLVYQDFVQKYGVDAPYSSLPYSPNQLFWISLANEYCTMPVAESWFLNDEHPPNDKRVIAMVSNSPEFVRDFNCPMGSKMNPQIKCNLF